MKNVGGWARLPSPLVPSPMYCTVFKITTQITKQTQHSVELHVLTSYWSKEFEIHESNSLKCTFSTLVNATIDFGGSSSRAATDSSDICGAI